MMDERETLFPLRDRSAFRLQGIHITHPGAVDRDRGVQSEAWLAISRPSGSIIEVPLTEAELVRFIADATQRLATLYRPPPGPG